MTANRSPKGIDQIQQPIRTQTEVFELNEQERTVLNHLVNGLSYKMIAAEMQTSYAMVNLHH